MSDYSSGLNGALGLSPATPQPVAIEPRPVAVPNQNSPTTTAPEPAPSVPLRQWETYQVDVSA